MKTLYIECEMGAAGDMLSAALYELLSEEQKKEYLEEINKTGIEGVKVTAEPSVKCGITGTHMSVLIDGEEEGHEHNHHHDHEEGHEHHHHHDHEEGHEHHHHHHHASLADVHGMINGSSFSDNVKAEACKVYDCIAAAESHAHGKEVSEIHFHEVGMKDAIVDVLGCCRLIEMIGVDKIVVSPVCVGFGEVKCAHGIIPVPAPATAHILHGVPVYAGKIRGEMCTPTGAAVLKSIADEFGSMPGMMISSVGYGMGKKDFEKANCVRAFLGDSVNETVITEDINIEREDVVELSTNIDDMTGEALAFCAEKLREAGALEVFTTPVFMKKNRPGQVITVLCKADDENKMAALIFKHTTTWGIRRRNVERHCMSRKIVQIQSEFGPVRVKIGTGYGVTKIKPEYDDLMEIAARENISINEVAAAVIKQAEGLDLNA